MPDAAQTASTLHWDDGDHGPLAVAVAELVTTRADAMRAAQVGLVVQDGACRIRAVDDAAAKALGLSVEQMLGRSAVDSRWTVLSDRGLPLPPGLHPALRTIADGTPVSGVLLGVQVPGPAPHTRSVWVEVDTEPVRVEGEVAGVLSFVRDVTNTDRGRTATDAALDTFRIVAENSSDVLLLSGPDGIVQWVSPSVSEVLGWAPGRVVGRWAGELVHPDDLDGIRSLQAEALSEGRNRQARLVNRYLTAGGGWRWMSARGTALFDASGSLVAGLDSLRDVQAEVLAEQEMEEGRRRDFRRLAENATDVVVQLDPEGVIEWISPSAEAVIGQSAASATGRSMAEFLHPADVAEVRRLLGAPRGPARDSSGPMTLRVRTSAGNYRWFEGSLRTMPNASSPGEAQVSWVGGWHDIQAEVEAREALQRSEELFRVGMRSAGIAMSIGRPDAAFTSVNPAMCRFLGRSAHELASVTWRDVTHPDDVDAELPLLEEVVAGLRDGYRLTKRYLHADGSVRWGDLTVAAVREPSGGLSLVIAQVVDVTEVRHAQDALAYMASYDPLTGLHNRAWTMQEIDQLAGRGTGEVVVVVIDLDDFHRVNESWGHQIGDQVLREVAGRLTALVPAGARLGRAGADEFVVVVPGFESIGQLEYWARGIRDALDVELSVEGQLVPLRVSIGIAVSAPGATASTLLQDADTALVWARSSPQSVEFFAEPMRAESTRRLTVEQELRRAVRSHELVVHFQPIVRLTDESVVGHEALVRWQHPERDLLGPADFLDVAEDTGLVRDLGRVVLEKVCQRLTSGGAGLGIVSINVSAVELTDPEWMLRFLRTVEASGVDPQRLVVEVTETSVLSILGQVRSALRGVRDLGAGVHVDDFGTGYSSISLLRDLPVTGLKLDRSFVHGLTPHPSRANALAGSLAQLAEGMGLVSVAEGIETSEQSRQLLSLGWQLGQGYYYGRPGPFGALDAGG